jgi:hypothetical protein
VKDLCKCGARLALAVHPAVDASEDVVGLSPAWQDETKRGLPMQTMAHQSVRQTRHLDSVWPFLFWKMLDSTLEEDGISPRLELG